MPLTEQQKEDYNAQAAALRKKLVSCAKDIEALLTLAETTETDPTKVNLFSAKMARATESKKSFIEAWDRLILIYIKLGQESAFPNDEEEEWKECILGKFDQAKAAEISFSSEPFQQASQWNNTRPESRSSFALLERIKLPHFDGDVTSWARYRDVFTSLVDKDPRLDSITKLYLLRDSLSGEALSVVNKFDVTSANYPLAWKALMDAYENERVLAAAYLEKIFDFKMPIKPGLTDYQKFLTEVGDNVSAFRALNLENPEDKILVLAMLRTLDKETRHKFELAHIGTDFPSADTLIKFIRNKCQALKLADPKKSTNECCTSNDQRSHGPRAKNASFPKRSSPRYHHQSFLSSTPSLQSLPKESVSINDTRVKKRGKPLVCPFCSQDHALSRCPVFTGLSIDDRHAFASKWKGCFNCLSAEHKLQECKSRWNCRICQERHHSLLHKQEIVQKPPSANENLCAQTLSHPSQLSSNVQDIQDTTVILGTARVLVRDAQGRNHYIRLLLDSGSHKSFITHKCAKKLGLKVNPTRAHITGLGGSHVAETLGTTQLVLNSLHCDTHLRISASVLSKVITSPLPQHSLPSRLLEKFQHLTLADPFFDKPQEIDLLLGADHYDAVISGTFRRNDETLPAILPTIFGDVVMGPFKESNSSFAVSLLCQPLETISSQLEAFWKLEEPCPVSRQSPEDIHCEEHFAQTHTRNPEGRYVVRLPFKSNCRELPGNHATARKRFASLEAKFKANPEFRNEYVQFMKEYIDLGHARMALNPSPYLIPHFGIKQRKMRVVFDASCKSDNISLNDVLLPGPRLQPDICDVLTLFRLFPIAITTDIVKMYRQILVHPEDRKFLHILWREDPQEDLMELELNTVTYGVSPSAFQALRTIIQLIRDEGKSFPLAVSRLRKKIFVDDIASGADTEEEARTLCQQLVQLFLRGGFALSKWSSNVPSVLPEGCEASQVPLSPQLENFATVKVLGLIWNPHEDTFAYIIHEPLPSYFTKRTVLSFISRIFDPLGFLAPTIFLAKLFVQDLWRNQADWDDRLPAPLHERWEAFISTWNDLSNIRIPRYTLSRHRHCRLAGFCDASARGYAAVIYLQVAVSANEFKTFLLKSKTKVAPTKYLSIARLELCGAFLLSKMLASLDLDDVVIVQKTLFTDSSVVLAWINTPSHLLHVFEANRVAAINECVPDADWRHVRTEDNPADIASRGLQPSQIGAAVLWWNGPSWLRLPETSWPVSTKSNHPPIVFGAHTTTPSQQDAVSWMHRFSSYHTLLRVVVLVMRFARKSSHCFTKYSDPITPKELNKAAMACAKAVQKSLFPKGTSSPELTPLSAFHDELGVLRVGGRLANAAISYSAKHPVLIPRSSHLARLIILDIHEKYFHCGPSLTLSMLRAKFWIPSALRLIKSIIAHCITCFRLRPTTLKAKIAPLPPSRLAPGRAFLHTGVDYAGPFTMRDSHRRKATMSKAYLCLFVCLSTKALHLEAVTSLTTEAFLATLDRFIARRGKPQVIHSDNATNFTGAARYLKELATFLRANNGHISSYLLKSDIEWRFIPPRSPHFGGIWETGVKSVKTLLRSTVAQQPFTFEEFTTLLARIESMLNSRPLCALTDDKDSFEPLTPGHFLIGSSMCAPPEEALIEVPANRLSHWQHVQQMTQRIWRRWHRDYLNTLQQRNRWRKGGPNLRVGDLVIMMERSSPTGLWPMARVTDIHPGSDGVVRVVTVKTPTGDTFKRSIHHLALLPFPSSDRSA